MEPFSIVRVIGYVSVVSISPSGERPELSTQLPSKLSSDCGEEEALVLGWPDGRDSAHDVRTTKTKIAEMRRRTMIPLDPPGLELPQVTVAYPDGQGKVGRTLFLYFR